MSVTWLSVLSGFIGGVIPGGLHLAWTFTRGTKVNSGTIDLTLRKKLK